MKSMMIQLRPPADADNYRVQAGRFGDRFYTDPLPADETWGATSDNDIYPAISTVKKAHGNDWSKAMAKRLAKSPSQLVEIGNLTDEFERKERINLLSDVGLGQASGRGTIVHQHAEALLMNRLPIYQMTDEVKPYIRTLEAFFAAYNPKLVAAEFVAIHRSLNAHNVMRGNEYMGYGGTGDAVTEIDGELWLIDWKSRAEDSDHKAYPEEGAQVSAYGRADYWIVGDDESPNGAKRITPLDLAGGLIVSIKPDSYECYPIDLDEGFAFWADLHAWWQARRSERRPVGRKWAPRVASEPAVTSQIVIEEVRTEAGELDIVPPTPASNRARFDALPEIKKNWARERFKRKGLKPNNPATAGEVSRILGEIEGTPQLRDMQETRAEQIAEHTERPEPKRKPTLDEEGGPANDELVNESKVMFDLVIGEVGRKWTGLRVTEANEADVSFRISELRSMKRANLYAALTLWTSFRGEMKLLADEEEGNVEFASILFMVDGCEDGTVPLGARLGMLTPEESQRLASEIMEVVQSETGDNPVTETETQPA